MCELPSFLRTGGGGRETWLGGPEPCEWGWQTVRQTSAHHPPTPPCLGPLQNGDSPERAVRLHAPTHTCEAPPQFALLRREYFSPASPNPPPARYLRYSCSSNPLRIGLRTYNPRAVVPCSRIGQTGVTDLWQQGARTSFQCRRVHQRQRVGRPPYLFCQWLHPLAPVER